MEAKKRIISTLAFGLTVLILVLAGAFVIKLTLDTVDEYNKEVPTTQATPLLGGTVIKKSYNNDKNDFYVVVKGINADGVTMEECWKVSHLVIDEVSLTDEVTREYILVE